MKTVFCDEAGFTGENLWQLDQPFFVYSAVAISEQEAAETVKSAKRHFRINTAELHASQLLRKDRGKQAVLSIVKSLIPQSSVICFHKRFTIAGKMFEYLIEPAISRNNSVFYHIGFHKFVANGLYLALMTEPEKTEQSFIHFQEAMRTGEMSCLDNMANSMAENGIETFLGQLSTFVLCNRRFIDREIGVCDTHAGVPRWMLELTTAALMGILTTLSGQRMDPLSVVCDESKPLLAQVEMFDSQIDRTDFRELTFNGRKQQITFNLARPIQLGSSLEHFGLQLADLVAGAATFALKHPNDPFSKVWMQDCQATLHYNSVYPQIEEFDITTQRAVVNSLVLNELVERSVLGKDLLLNMPEFIKYSESIAPQLVQDMHV